MSWRYQKPRTDEQQVAKLGDLGLPFGADTAYAYSPRESGNAGGAVHVYLLEPFTQGRIARDKGDTLCNREFWGLDRGKFGGEVTCRRCLELARRIAARAAAQQ